MASDTCFPKLPSVVFEDCFVPTKIAQKPDQKVLQCMQIFSSGKISVHLYQSESQSAYWKAAVNMLKASAIPANNSRISNLFNSNCGYGNSNPDVCTRLLTLQTAALKERGQKHTKNQQCKMCASGVAVKCGKSLSKFTAVGYTKIIRRKNIGVMPNSHHRRGTKRDSKIVIAKQLWKHKNNL